MVNKKYENILRLGLGLTLVSVILYIVVNHGIETSYNWTTIGDEILVMFGWLFALGMAFIYFLSGKQDMLRNILYSSFIGISISYLLGYMFDGGIYFDTVIVGDNLLWEVQLIIVVLWVIVGIIKGVVDNG